VSCFRSREKVTSTGKLLLIGTPLGNLSDLSPRGRSALGSVELLLCEDTRHTQKLLSAFGISVPTSSFHDHNEREQVERLIERLESGATIGVVSDAGLPLLSDPGFPLVRAARERGITIEPIPGPFAAATALIASGIAPLPFAFFGFPPRKREERLDFYRMIGEKRMTAVVYESAQRIIDSLSDARRALGEVEVTIGREMTKLHEEFINGTISTAIELLEGRGEIRGEITLVLAAPAAVEPDEELTAERLAAELEKLRQSGLRRSDAIKILAERYGLRRQELYRQLVGKAEP
jgi:16S rRNA (cytidine1402-2'-O)-methyltransferase